MLIIIQVNRWVGPCQIRTTCKTLWNFIVVKPEFCMIEWNTKYLLEYRAKRKCCSSHMLLNNKDSSNWDKNNTFCTGRKSVLQKKMTSPFLSWSLNLMAHAVCHPAQLLHANCHDAHPGTCPKWVWQVPFLSRMLLWFSHLIHCSWCLLEKI